jgi:hypothetical protein
MVGLSMSRSASSYQRIAPKRAMNTRWPLLTKRRVLLGAVEIDCQGKLYPLHYAAPASSELIPGSAE